MPETAGQVQATWWGQSAIFWDRKFDILDYDQDVETFILFAGINMICVGNLCKNTTFRVVSPVLKRRYVSNTHEPFCNDYLTVTKEI